jgi:hypothetical protein
MTRQEPAGATIAAADSLTYARPHAAFFHSDRAAGDPAPRVGAAAHSVDGDIVNGNSLPPPLLTATAPSTLWTAACAIIERPMYASAKRRTFNQNQEQGRPETRELPTPDTNLKNAFRGPTNGVHVN